MLLKNIDVSDGLVNGARETDRTFPSIIQVLFDDTESGAKLRQSTSSSSLPQATPIEAVEEIINNNGDIRIQFLLKLLAWACTIHKVT